MNWLLKYLWEIALLLEDDNAWIKSQFRPKHFNNPKDITK
jgi:hypothetical protein